MPTHQSSNFATYSDPSGQPVFDTFFIRSNWGGEDQLFAFRSPDDREKALASFAERGFTGQALTHQEAFLAIRDGLRAWFHCGDIPTEDVWSPIKVNYPARVA